MEAVPVMHLGSLEREALINDGWQHLAEAIVLQAVKDYRKLRRYLQNNPEDERANLHLVAIAEFFCSEWFKDLCDLDGQELLRRLRTERRRSRRHA